MWSLELTDNWCICALRTHVRTSLQAAVLRKEGRCQVSGPTINIPKKQLRAQWPELLEAQGPRDVTAHIFVDCTNRYMACAARITLTKAKVCAGGGQGGGGVQGLSVLTAERRGEIDSSRRHRPGLTDGTAPTDTWPARHPLHPVRPICVVLIPAQLSLVTWNSARWRWLSAGVLQLAWSW
jgi:hypothetical protein